MKMCYHMWNTCVGFNVYVVCVFQQDLLCQVWKGIAYICIYFLLWHIFPPNLIPHLSSCHLLWTSTTSLLSFSFPLTSSWASVPTDRCPYFFFVLWYPWDCSPDLYYQYMLYLYVKLVFQFHVGFCCANQFLLHIPLFHYICQMLNYL